MAHTYGKNPLAAADPGAVVKGDCYRFTVLADQVIRMEYDPDGCFVDGEAQIVLNRGFPVPEFHVNDIEPKYGRGWTGCAWNRKLFPDPAAMMDELHKRGMHVSLNVHPADGVHAHEEMYPEMAAALGVDAEHEVPIQFNVADRRFMDAYFKYLHHPNEEIGVDFWWIDWQQGSNALAEG